MAEVLEEQMSRLRSVRSSPCQATADGLAAWSMGRGALEEDEAAWVSSIEALRTRLLESTELLPSTSGASDPLPIAHVTQKASKKPKQALMLFHLVRRWRPACGLELGTALGISAAYQAAAMALNGRGMLTTLEGSSVRTQVAADNLRALGLTNARVMSGRFEQILTSVLEDLAPVDYAFIDGHHDEHATVDYFDQVVSHFAPKGIVILDDIEWSEGMGRAWSRVKDRPGNVGIVQIPGMGIVVRDDTV